MKVLHLGKFCPPTEGGIENFSYDLIEYLNKKGINTDLICFGESTKKFNYKNFNILQCKMISKIQSAPLSYDYYRIFNEVEKNYDIIHIHSPNTLAEVLTLNSNKKIIIHWHSDIVKQKLLYFFYKVIQKIVIKKSDIIICTSQEYLNKSDQLKNFKNKVVIIPLGLNQDRLKVYSFGEDNDINFQFEKIKGKKIVLSVGRLVIHKGFKYLIKAGKYISEDAVILIVGGGPLYQNLKKMVVSEKLENKVFLLGPIGSIKIKYLLKFCDIFCLPSIMESFGLVLLEALYFGKPLITTNLEKSGMNYINHDGITGLIVPPKDPVSLANAINKLLSDKKMYETFSKNALDRFKEFEISSIGDKIIDLYKNVINQ